MNRLFCLLLVEVMLSANAYTQPNKQFFEINGALTGFADSTLLYLDAPTTPSSIKKDSTLILNNKFRFRGSIKEEAERAILYTKEYADYKMFWIEGTVMTFKTEKGNFRKAVITGSKTQTADDQLAAKIEEKGEDAAREQYIDFIKKNPNSILSTNLLNIYARTWGKDTTSLLYTGLSDKMKNTHYGKSIKEFIILNKDIQIGNKYVDFAQPNPNGKTIKLSDFRNKVVLLEFWGSWCIPCRKGHPELIKIYNEFKDQGFEIVGVAADDNKEQWVSAIKEDSLPWENITDLNGDKNKAILIYGINHYPASFLIDRNGIIIAKDLRGETLRDKLIEVLK